VIKSPVQSFVAVLSREHSRDLPIGFSDYPRNGSVVSSLHGMNDPQPEGHNGKLHRTTKILSDARRGGSLAARTASAAAGDAGDHPVGRDAERRELNRAFCSSLSEL
jgi:hypothetical protein